MRKGHDSRREERRWQHVSGADDQRGAGLVQVAVGHGVVPPGPRDKTSTPMTFT